MVEKPPIQDEAIIAFLQEAYAVQTDCLEFLPLGNDSNAGVYKVVAEDESYFLKAKQGNIYYPGLVVSKYLYDSGIKQVIAPLSMLSGDLYGRLSNFNLILYPFIAGEGRYGRGLAADQWREFGQVLRQIHTTTLPPEIAELLNREQFIFHWEPLLDRLQETISSGHYSGPIEKEAAAFWKEKEQATWATHTRARELGRMLKENPPPFVLCHSDIHLNNVLLTPTGKVYIVDWDDVSITPKERDLRYIVEGGDLDLFETGYGAAEINPIALEYYIYEWILQDIAACGEAVFFGEGFGEATKRHELEGLKMVFRSSYIVWHD